MEIILKIISLLWFPLLILAKYNQNITLKICNDVIVNIEGKFPYSRGFKLHFAVVAKFFNCVDGKSMLCMYVRAVVFGCIFVTVSTVSVPLYLALG